MVLSGVRTDAHRCKKCFYLKFGTDSTDITSWGTRILQADNFDAFPIAKCKWWCVCRALLAYDDNSIILDSTGTEYDEFVSKFSGKNMYDTQLLRAVFATQFKHSLKVHDRLTLCPMKRIPDILPCDAMLERISVLWPYVCCFSVCLTQIGVRPKRLNVESRNSVVQ